MSLENRPVIVIQHTSKQEFEKDCCNLFDMNYEIKEAGTYIVPLGNKIRVWWAICSRRRTE